MKALLEHEIPKQHSFRLWGTAVNDPPPFRVFGVKIIGWWGMTETITHGIVGEVDQPNIPMSIGRAAPEYEIRITDDDGTPTDTGPLPVSCVHTVPFHSQVVSALGPMTVPEAVTVWKLV